MMRPQNAVGLAVAAMILVGLPAAGGAFNDAEKASPFGVVDHTLYDQAKDIRAVWMRHPESIFHVEPAAGVFDFDSWENEFVFLDPRNLNFAPVVSIGKCWMSGFGGTPVDYPSGPPTDLSTTWSPSTGYSPIYYNYIYTVVSHFAGRFDHLTIENEANAEFWGGTADEYVRVLKTAYLAAHNADPDIMVFDSGLGSGVWGACLLRDRYESGLYATEQLVDFANEYYARDAYVQQHFDNWEELHTFLYETDYVVEQVERALYMIANMGGAVDGLNFKFTSDWWVYEDVVDYIRMKTGQAGYQVSFLCNNEASNWIGVSDLQQARELVQKYVVGLSLGVQRTLWFPFSWELDPSARVPLIDASGDPLPAYAAFRNAASIIGHEFAFDHLDLSASNVRQYVFRSRTDASHHLRVAWWDNGSHGAGSNLVRLSLPPATYRVIRSDDQGRRSVARVHGEDYMDILVNEIPVFVEFFQDLGQVTSTGYPAGDAYRRLEQNYPNPFNPQTSVRFSVPGGLGELHDTHLAIYDLEGSLVKTLIAGDRAAGFHTVPWYGETDGGGEAAAGVYIYRLRVGDVVESRKMILAK